ncbi:carboxypeptidase-like regulatory domain-containing protein [Granulicella sp. dw_53]|uniref:carboxypeptidase-like regulatory domain-containing protein n=1 Tax=Granulicella sp. dw_53 TaxID=2719792 RepID=UPI001BD6A33C|nr:carboxypeptidase-like regulatory domain-containing protein [Granulicella sp. dw_53]
MKQRSKALLWLFLLGVSVVTRLYAQVEGGIITGNVSDSSGAAISKASVDIVNVASGEHIPTTANRRGDFTSATLRPGTYSVTVTAPGFKTVIQDGLVLQVGSKSAVNVVLPVGDAGETVEVTAQAPAMETTQGTVGTVVEAQPVQELPLNGRNALALTLETPAVRSNSATNPQGFADRGTSLAAIVINNGPTAMNANLLDGANNLNNFSGELAINPAVDSVQEFKVQTGYMSAEYGLTGGGVITLASKSGSNGYHGDVYEFFRNDYLDARDWFLDPTSKKPPLRYNQFGGAVGGPVMRDKLFFFANFEEFRYVTSAVYTATVPTLRQRTGDFSDLQTCSLDANKNTVVKLVKIYDPATTKASGTTFSRAQFPGNKINRALDPVALNIQNAIYPTPNRTSSDACEALSSTNNFQSVKPNVRSMYQSLGRLDYRISSKQSMFARYAYYVNNTDNGSTNGSYLPSPIVAKRYDSFGSQSAVVEHTYVFSPSTINELRLAVTRTTFPFVVANYNQDWPSKLGFPTNVPPFVFPTITGTGLPAVNGQVGQRNTANPQIIDTVTVNHGRHNVRFGFVAAHSQSNNSQLTTPSGNFSFSSALTNLPSSTAGTGSAYASFLLGSVQSATLTVYREPGYWNFLASGFIQDDFKVSPRFTINAGLRYDFQETPHEHHDGLSNFDPNGVSPSVGQRGTTAYAQHGGYGRTFTGNDYKDYGPRLGFAWDVFGDGKTSLRGGAGIYYVSLNNQLFNQPTAGFSSTTTSYTSTNSGITPALQLSNGFSSPPLQPLGADGGPDFLLGQAIAYVQPKSSTPMSQQWNLNIQHELPGRFVTEIGYLGNYGVHMIAGDYNMNVLPNQYLSLGTALTQNVPNPYAGKVPGSLGAATITRKQSLLPFPYYGAITVTSPRDGNFHGDAMFVAVQRHGNHGLTLLSSYTFSKLLDNGIQDALDGYIGVSTAGGAVTPQDPNNRQAEYSLDPTDIKHRFVGSALYELPFGHGKKFFANGGGVVDRLIRGWQFNTIVTAQSGLPIRISGANNSAASRPNFVAGKTAANVNKSDRSVKSWFDTTVFQNPDPYTFGNVPRVLPNSRGPKYIDVDASVFKTTNIAENVDLQLRLESFNMFNHPNFGLPSGAFVPASGNNGLNTSSSFGQITTDFQPRNVQLAVKVIF